MICGLSMKKGTNIKQFGNRRHHMRIAMQTNQTSVTYYIAKRLSPLYHIGHSHV